jgi:hypothetical protein
MEVGGGDNKGASGRQTGDVGADETMPPEYDLFPMGDDGAGVLPPPSETMPPEYD